MGKAMLFIDGAARENPDGPGGYGAVPQFMDSTGTPYEKELSAGYVWIINNRTELMATIAGLEVLNHPCEMELYSDFRYFTDAFSWDWIDKWVENSWKRKTGPVKNIDL